MNLTALVINFLREPYMLECLKSLQKYNITVLVGENGEYSEETKQKVEALGAKYIKLPFDSGVTGGRNRLLKHVKTDYFLVGDDDFYYTNEANIENMVAFLEKNKSFDLIGGRVRENGKIQNYQSFMELKNNILIYTPLKLDRFKYDGNIQYKECDLTFNFFVGRTSTLKDIEWDENIKVSYEHSDYFLTLQKYNKKVAFTPDAVVVHKPAHVYVPPNEYSKYRRRKNDKDYFFEKHKIRMAIDIHGRRDVHARKWLNEIDFCIKHFMRKPALERLLFSIAEYYPDANVYIGDDSYTFDAKYYRDLWQRLFDAGMLKKPVALNLGRDIGISAGRNKLVEQTPNHLKLMLDDDFIFTEETNIRLFYDILKDTKCDLVGGALRQDGNIRNYEGFLRKYGKHLKQKPLEDIQDINDVDVVFNFFLATKQALLLNPWDEDIKIAGEHTRFFLQAKKRKLKIKYTPNVIITHKQDLQDKTYKQHRARNEFLTILYEKEGLKTIENFNGVKYRLNKDGSITKYR